MVWDAAYRPFGEATVSGPLTFNLRFPGQYYDAETALHYNYFRDYDPTTGRYIQSDPIGLQGGWNTYAYVEGRPTAFIDTLGLYVSVCCRPIRPGSKWYHCYLARYSASGGLEETYGMHGKGATYYYSEIVQNAPFDKGKAGRICGSQVPDKYWNCVLQAVKEYQKNSDSEGRFEYNFAEGPNSNTFANYCASKPCGNVPKPSLPPNMGDHWADAGKSAPGWNAAPAGPYVPGATPPRSE